MIRTRTRHKYVGLASFGRNNAFPRRCTCIDPFLMKLLLLEGWEWELSDGANVIKIGSILRKLWSNPVESFQKAHHVIGKRYPSNTTFRYILPATIRIAHCNRRLHNYYKTLKCAYGRPADVSRSAVPLQWLGYLHVEVWSDTRGIEVSQHAESIFDGPHLWGRR